MYEVAYPIQIEGFEGTLGLLLQLVEKEKVDVFDVPIAFILLGYLETLEKDPRADIDLGGDIIATVAQLTYLKSRLLLPKEAAAPIEEPTAEEAQRILRERMETYRMFQEAAHTLAKQNLLGRDVFPRGKAGAETPPEPGLAVELFSLLQAFHSVLARAKINTPHEVIVQRLSLADRLQQVIDRLRSVGSLQFEELFDDVFERSGIIVTFLSILELAKLRLICVEQREQSAPIMLSWKETRDGAS